MIHTRSLVILGFPCGSAGKESAFNEGDLGLIPGSGRSPGEGKGYPLQYSGLENSMDYTVLGVTNSWTWLSNFHFHFWLYHWVGSASLKTHWTPCQWMLFILKPIWGFFFFFFFLLMTLLLSSFLFAPDPVFWVQLLTQVGLSKTWLMVKLVILIENSSTSCFLFINRLFLNLKTVQKFRLHHLIQVLFQGQCLYSYPLVTKGPILEIFPQVKGDGASDDQWLYSRNWNCRQPITGYFLSDIFYM